MAYIVLEAKIGINGSGSLSWIRANGGSGFAVVDPSTLFSYSLCYSAVWASGRATIVITTGMQIVGLNYLSFSVSRRAAPQQYREALETLTRLNTVALRRLNTVALETPPRLRSRLHTIMPGNDADTLAFLAMTRHRLGQRDSARATVDKLNALINEFKEMRGDRSLLLRSEAEAVVLYDPIFPADPFAH
jgi:hypothetical protein